VKILDLDQLTQGAGLEIRGDGKAGGGLLLAFQSLADLMAKDPELHVQEWPFFSSARRGASIRSFMRVSRRPVTAACEVTRPHVVILMNEAAARTWDFAEGVPPGGTFVINTHRTPEECARHFRLSGRVITVPGDEIGRQFLKHAIGNVSVYYAAAQVVTAAPHEAMVESFMHTLAKRHLPNRVLDSNRAALDATAAAIQTGVFDEAAPGAHVAHPFEGYDDLPVGAQTPLRLSRNNRTADYAPSGFRLRFEDSADACTGCAHCINACPEGIIRFEPDSERGLRVVGVDVNRFCKLCGECIAICPEHLFKQAPFEEHWEEVTLT
jgi:2-oxoacid:acceptor oxidoreductase gamma subunit (pyruvate/2-ketoisovalerate family)